MKILRAKIDGFGRYQERSFAFGQGLNVIYGKNEAGKSTLQQFLLAMLYGMKKTGRKRTVYLEEEAKYRPWQGTNYGGVLFLEVDGTEYRIERNLRREEERTRVFRQDTGEEVTARFALDSRKELTFAQQLWQADRELFVNTLCIGPVQERERAAWLGEVIRGGEVVGQGEGLHTADALTTPEQQKVRSALEALAKQLEAIGSERALTKPYGQALKNREELARALQEAKERERSQKEALLLAQQMTEEWERSAQAAKELHDELAKEVHRYLALLEVRRQQLDKQWNAVEQALAEHRQMPGADMDEADFRQLQTDLQRFLTAKREAESYRKRIEALAAESEEAAKFVQRYKSLEEERLQEVEQTAYELERLEQTAESAGPSQDLDALDDWQAQVRSKKRKMWISFAVAVLMAPFGLSQMWALLIVVALLGFGVYNYFSAQKLASVAEEMLEQQAERHALAEAARERQEALEARLLDLLSAFDVDTPRQYRQKWTQLLRLREQMAQTQKQLQWLHGEANRAQGERDILGRRLLRMLGEEERQAAGLNPEALQAAVARLERQFAEAQERKEQVHAWEKEQAELLHLLQALHKERERWQETVEALGLDAEAGAGAGGVALDDSFPFPVPEDQNALERADVTERLEQAAAGAERLLQALRTAERDLLEKKAACTEATARYQTMSEGQKSAQDLLLELQRAEEEVQGLLAEREALLIAQEVWSEVTEDLYQALAPQFAAALSEVTARLTEGRYQEVFFDREQTVTTISPDSGKTVELSALSEGTIDQITFALGLAMSGWMIPGGEKLPMLLDEPFRRYDDQRWQAVLRVLLQEAERRQIFLFTCREQEVERLLEIGGDSVHVVELGKDEYGILKMS